MFERAEREHKNYNPNNLYGPGTDHPKNFAGKNEPPAGYPAREHAGGDYDRATGTYIIKQGDTLYSISQRFNTNIESIKHLNGAGALKMDPGARLKIKPGLHLDETKKETSAEHKHTDAPAGDEKKPADTFSLSHLEEVISGFNPATLWEKFPHPEPELSKPLKDWMDRTVTADDTFEKNKRYTQMVLDAADLKLIDIEDEPLRYTFKKIKAGEKIGKDTGETFDPKISAISILPIIVAMIKGLIKTYGDKVYEHKFGLGTFMIWNNDDTKLNRVGGALRPGRHGEGRAFDLHGIASSGNRNFDNPEAMSFVINMLDKLPPGSYGIGLPQQGDFFPKNDTSLVQGVSANDVYKKIKSKELVSLIGKLEKNGRHLMVFPDAANHLHIGVEP